MSESQTCILCGIKFEDHDENFNHPRRICYSCQATTDSLRGTPVFDLIWRLAERITDLESWRGS